MKTTTFFTAFWMGLVWASSAQSTIAYFDGPAFQVAAEGGSACLDLDKDGISDFVFTGGPFICTEDVPTSGCTAFYDVSPINSNGVLCVGSQVMVMSAGTTIGGLAAFNSQWNNSNEVTMASYSFSPRFGTAGWGEALGAVGDGYLGVRIHRPDGLHYGWIHASLPSAAMENAPAIIEWAYETRADRAIAAGAKPVLALLATPGIVRPRNLRLSWLSQTGAAYQVQAKSEMDAGAWTNLSFTLIATGTNSLVDVPISNAAGFYRVVQAE